MKISRRRWGLAGVARSHYFSVAPLLFCFALLFFPFGGKRVHMTAGTKTPAAHGEIVVKVGPNNNVKLAIRTDSLAKPAALTPPESVYVVWLQRPDKKPENLGQLQVNDHLKGSLTTVTPYKQFKVFITAEQDPQAQAPGGPQVLWAEITGAET